MKLRKTSAIIVALVLITALCAALAGCGRKGSSPPPKDIYPD